MSPFRNFARLPLTGLYGLVVWLAAGPTASAQVLLAQSGAAKSILGWLLTLLAIALGLIVVCRPSSRKDPDKKEKQARK